MEQTLILVKPDGVQRGLVGQIVSRFENRGMKLVGLKLIHMTNELAAQHYSAHQGKDFYDNLIEYIVSGPVVAMVWSGKDAIAAARATMGSTKPVDALPGTIRGDFGMEIGRNLVHGSDSPQNAKKEVALFFDKSELINWLRDIDKWIKE
ncbi:MAG TPA: nucleoside-diphosphate kinase [Patescibacteria group bacterium]|jgi:nucleoside-diphosphate kinase|nr:nucleoside-diphosphate kinase [Patescibacteria group bacterium]